MIYEHLFAHNGDQQIRAGLIGTGAYGTSLLAQVQYIPRLKVPVVCDQDIGAAQRACEQAGIPREDIAICENRKDALRAFEGGKCAITEDYTLLMDLPLEVIVECTGSPEAGARHAELATQSGKHVAMVNKETDSVIGPVLHHLANKVGVVYTPVDGDQHGLLIGLVSWARSLGLEVVCGGKAHTREFVYSEDTRTVFDGVKGIVLSREEMEVLCEIPSGQAGYAVEARRQVLKDLGHISAADLCESVIAANATGLMPDVPLLHGPIVRIIEIPEVLSHKKAGGILGTEGAIDVVICLRRPDEAGLAGGVFIVFSCDNDYIWDFLQAKGIITSRRADYGLIYRPYHLLGVETPISILCAGLLNLSTGGVTVEPRVDLAARTARDLKAGSVLEATGGGPESPLEPLIVASVPVQKGNPLPLYLAAGNRLKTDVSAGAILSADMVEAPSASRLWALRREQDQMFKIAG